ncbi:MAG TPA: DUF1080 domain-containing protein [Chthonomonadales bacterium]|nr:DUF1080 domain-containing protein [Chthonomonadales bacterium]
MALRWIVLAIGLCIAVSVTAQTARRTERGFTRIFDGRTLAGWQVSGKTGHGTGGRWFVQDGAIHGTQDRPGNGGIIITERQYGDFEVALEMRNDYGPNSGLFLRSTEDGRCYQATIDYHAGGGLMGVYGEGIGGFYHRNFELLETSDRIREVAYPAFPLPVTPERWARLWRPGRWNELRARIVGNPPTITTWINGVKIMEWTDTERRLPDTGGIALQVHGGGDLTRQFVRYRNIRVRTITRP